MERSSANNAPVVKRFIKDETSSHMRNASDPSILKEIFKKRNIFWKRWCNGNEINDSLHNLTLITDKITMKKSTPIFFLTKYIPEIRNLRKNQILAHYTKKMHSAFFICNKIFFFKDFAKVLLMMAAINLSNNLVNITHHTAEKIIVESSYLR